MFEINKDKENKFNFKINITGAPNSIPSCRFVIQLNDNTYLFFRGSIDEINTANVIVPKLNNIINKNMQILNPRAFLEIIVDSSYFIPWESSIIFKEEVSVTAIDVITNSSNIELKANLEGIIVESTEIINKDIYLEEIQNNEINTEISQTNDVLKENEILLTNEKLENKENIKDVLIEKHIEPAIFTKNEIKENSSIIKENIIILKKTYCIENMFLHEGSKITIL